jgi:hypothetical protein
LPHVEAEAQVARIVVQNIASATIGSTRTCVALR